MLLQSDYMIKSTDQKQSVQKVLDIIRNNKGEAYLVGGCVRDLILGRIPNDYDIATNLMPSDIMKIFSKVIPTGIDHLTVTVLMDDYSFEVTTYRTENDYSDGRHPDEVFAADTIEEDLSRRDFTMNAIASKSVDITLDNLVDPFGGFEDINRRYIRCVGNPTDRFNEDKLRALRAVRFASQLGCFKIDSLTYNEIQKVSLEQISRERIQTELIKILSSDYPCQGIETLRDTGLLKQFAHELLEGVDVDGGNNHKETIWDHNLLALQSSVPLTKDWRLRKACLFHDVGKPRCISNTVDGIHFYEHEHVGADMVKVIMTRLKFSNSDIDYVYTMVKNHMHTYKIKKDEISKRAIKQIVRSVGQENVWDMVILNYCDHDGNKAKEKMPFRIYVEKRSIWNRWEEIRKQDAALKVTDLKVDGHDMMKLGYIGKYIGLILNDLLNEVDYERLKNNHEDLIDYAKKKKDDI